MFFAENSLYSLKSHPLKITNLNETFLEKPRKHLSYKSMWRKPCIFKIYYCHLFVQPFSRFIAISLCNLSRSLSFCSLPNTQYPLRHCFSTIEGIISAKSLISCWLSMCSKFITSSWVDLCVASVWILIYNQYDFECVLSWINVLGVMLEKGGILILNEEEFNGHPFAHVVG